MPALKQLDDEIKRVGDSYYNYTEPPSQGIVKTIYNNVNGSGLYGLGLTIEGLEMDFPFVPVLFSCFDTNPNLSVKVGDPVLIIFIGGQLTNPLVIGKISNGGV